MQMLAIEELQHLAETAYPGECQSIALYGSAVYAPRSKPSDIDILVLVAKNVDEPRYARNINGLWHMYYAISEEELRSDTSEAYFGYAIASRLLLPITIIGGSDRLLALQHSARVAMCRFACKYVARRLTFFRTRPFPATSLFLFTAILGHELSGCMNKIWDRIVPFFRDFVRRHRIADTMQVIANQLVTEGLLQIDGQSYRFSETFCAENEANDDVFEIELRRMMALDAAHIACRGWRSPTRWAETINDKFHYARQHPAAYRQLLELVVANANVASSAYTDESSVLR